MQIENVNDYNRRDYAKYSARIEEWRKLPMGAPMPQVAFYGFYDTRGNLRTRGFVASDERSAYYAPPKAQAIAKYNQAKL